MTIGNRPWLPKFAGQTLSASNANDLDSAIDLGAQCSVGPWPNRSESALAHVFDEAAFEGALTVGSASLCLISPWISESEHTNETLKSETFYHRTASARTQVIYASDWIMDQVEAPGVNSEICDAVFASGGGPRTEFAWTWDVGSTTICRIALPAFALIDGAELTSATVFMLRTAGSGSPVWTVKLLSIKNGTATSDGPGLGGSYSGVDTINTTVFNRTIDKSANWFIELTSATSPSTKFGVYKIYLNYASTRRMPYVRSYT